MQSSINSPTLVSFAITRMCNLHCPHCYSQSVAEPESDELTTGEAKKVISQIADAGAHMVIFDGGEPLLRKDLPELVKHAADCGLRPLLGTNATVLTEEVAIELKQAGLRVVAVSLDGATPETHDRFRGQKGSMRDTLKGIEILRNVGLDFQIAPCITRHNWAELPQIVKLAKELGTCALEIFDYIESGRGKANPAYSLTKELRKAMLEQVIEMQRKEELVFRVIGAPQYWPLVEMTVPDDEALEKFVRACCGAGTRYACILYNGDVYPCMVLQIKAGNLRQKSFQEIWQNSEVFATLRNRQLLKGKCGQCRYKRVCGGARCKAYEASGDIMAEDPTCWFTEAEVA